MKLYRVGYTNRWGDSGEWSEKWMPDDATKIVMDANEKPPMAGSVYYLVELPEDYITDGFGSYWLKDCPHCGALMQVIRPGDARCSAECYIKPEG